MRSIPEWIGEHDDQAIPARVQERVWRKAKSRCQGQCRRRLGPKDHGEMDHIVALADGGEHREKNLCLKCSWCHSKKTSSEAQERARSSRKFQSFMGIKTPTKHPVPGSRSTPWARRYDRETGCFRTVPREGHRDSVAGRRSRHG